VRGNLAARPGREHNRGHGLSRAPGEAMMAAVLELAGAALGFALVARGLRIALSRPRPRDLGGMILAAAGLALAVAMLTAASGVLGRD
jgi:hypothetical protein